MNRTQVHAHTFQLMKNRPSFLSGFASILDFRQSIAEHYRTQETNRQADDQALQADWLAVGNDLKEAMNQYDQGKKIK